MWSIGLQRVRHNWVTEQQLKKNIICIFFLLKLYILGFTSLGLHCCAQAFSSCSEQRLLFLVVQSSHCVGFSYCRAHGFSSYETHAQQLQLTGSRVWAQLLCSMSNLLRPGMKLISPALAGGFLPTLPPGKSYLLFLDRAFYKCQLDSKQLIMFIPFASLLIFCLLVLSATKEIVTSPTITVDFSILLFISVSFYFTHFKALLLGGSSMWKYTDGDNFTGFPGTRSHGYSSTDLEQPKFPWERKTELEE